jgi:hypothetical protein
VRTDKQVRTQLDAVYKELERIQKSVPAGAGIYRNARAYADALEWVLKED